MAYQIIVTVQGPPDQLVCEPAANGGFLISGACVLPDSVIGLPYQGLWVPKTSSVLMAPGVGPSGRVLG
jgi:hypothetical protein